MNSVELKYYNVYIYVEEEERKKVDGEVFKNKLL